MKKIYSIVLMATALLIGTTASAATVAKIGTTEYETFEAAWKAAQNNDEILLTAKKVEIGTTLWLGTTTMADTDPLSITLNLGGDTLMSTAQKMFVLTHGSLTVKNGVIQHAPTGSLMSGSEYNSAIEVFRVFGSTYKDVDSKEVAAENLYTHLTIEASAKIIAAVNGITVDNNNGTAFTVWAAGEKTAPTWADLKTNVYASGTGVAHGVRIDVKGYIEARKYAIKANGNLGAPNQLKSGYPLSTHKQDREGTQYAVLADDAKNFSPYIHVYSSAKLLTTEFNRTDAVAAYSSGYARWLVEGTVEGSTAVYIKSGELDVKNATITSNFTGTRSESTEDKKSGVDAGGSGIAIESSANYAGGTSVTIEGNTVITPTKGLALDEKITNAADTSKVESVEIKGGTFKEGDAGTIKVTTETTNGTGKTESTSVTIDGGTFEFADNTQGSNTGVDLGGKTLEQFLTDQAATSEITHTVIVSTDDQGHQTIVISDGNKPAEANSVIAAAQDASINWINASVTTETLTADKKLAELQISQDYNQTLIVPDGLTLEVGRVVLGAKAQIIVEAGGKFIVTGTQGLAAFQESNLVLKTSQDAQAIFLFNPAVTSNTHPMATVEFTSKSYRKNSSDWAKQIFGIPTHTQLTEITTKYNNAEVATGFEYFDYSTATWKIAGYIHMSGTMDYSKIANPFTYYRMQHNTPNAGTVVTMKGELTGNADAQLNVLGNFWCGYANSYMAPIAGAELLDMIGNGVDQAYYLYYVDEETNQWGWWEQSKLEYSNINPLQPFLLRNPNAAADVTIDYAQAVYNPTIAALNAAPARRTANNMTKAKLLVRGEGNVDRIVVAEDDQFSAAFDNGYDVVKYMEQGIKMYVSADEKMGIFATDDLNNTYVGFKAINGGNYTIEFANVQGKDLTLVDLETGIQTLMVEGNTYTFNAAANTTNDYRFQIINTNGIMTGIENAEAAKSAKGIYTITGIYVGEMNLWNALPAGVYVVNGEKRVK